MTDDEFKERVITLLEIIAEAINPAAFGAEVKEECAHEHANDLGVYGDKPGANMLCRDCGQTFSRIAEEHRG